MSVRVIEGDCRAVLPTMADRSVQMVMTSPPYLWLRDYGVAGQIGLEATPGEFIAEIVAVFREVRRVLRDDGTLWLNLGDKYANDKKWGGATGGKHVKGLHGQTGIGRGKRKTGFKPKDLMGIPWRVAIALQDDGWYLRRDIIWHKLNPMPESVDDRCTTAHEYLFHFSKSERYYYDAAAIFEPVSPNTNARLAQDVAAQIASDRANGGTRPGRTMKAVGRNSRQNVDRVPRKNAKRETGIKNNDSFTDAVCLEVLERNKRSVWSIATEGYPGAHFAMYPPALCEPCIKAGSKPGDVVLDPFGGAGTTGLVADRLGRDAVLIELNPQYAEMARARLRGDSPLFAEVS